MLGHRRGSSIFSQLRYALRRNASSHSGSFFFAEIRRTVSSLSPRGIVSASISVTQPYLYSRFASISAVLIFVSTNRTHRSELRLEFLNLMQARVNLGFGANQFRQSDL